jgi:hypothetical protein
MPDRLIRRLVLATGRQVDAAAQPSLNCCLLLLLLLLMMMMILSLQMRLLLQLL